MDAEAIYLELCVRADQAVDVTCLTASESAVVPCLLVAQIRLYRVYQSVE